MLESQLHAAALIHIPSLMHAFKFVNWDRLRHVVLHSAAALLHQHAMVTFQQNTTRGICRMRVLRVIGCKATGV